MRLTLRTLLAYLDDILDPADKEELNKKIESSDFAGDLILRTRDTVRRLRLSAPQVVGTGMGLDPNTVAEYLDNVLPPDQVGDFERICLESDMHLAEVASCHHVLTMVLGAPADIDSQARSRMYSIPLEAREGRHHRADPAHAVSTATIQPPTPTTSVVAAPAPDGHAASTAYASSQVPDYLRASAWSRYRGVFLGLAALVLVAATLLLAASLAGWLDRGVQTAAVPSPPVAPIDPAATPPGEPVHRPPEQTPAVAMEEPGQDVSAEGAIPPDGPPIATTPETGAPMELAPGMDRDPAFTEEERLAVPEAPADPLFPAPVVDDPATSAAVEAPAVAPSERDEVPHDFRPDGWDETEPEAPRPPEHVAALPDEPGGAAPPDGPVVTPLPPAPDETAMEADDVEVTQMMDADDIADIEALSVEEEQVPDLGTYLGGKTVLLRWDEADGAWYRVPPRSAVAAGDRFVALPEFRRPKLTFASGIHLDVSGGTQIVIDAANDGAADALAAAGDPAIDVVYGRIVLLNTSSSENSVRLMLGPNSTDVRLARNAVLGIEVARPFVPGLDPRHAVAPVEVALYASEDGVVWHDADGPMEIDEPSHWSIVDGAMSEMTIDPAPPEWLDGEPTVVRSERLYAVPTIEERLTTDRPANVQLLELYQSQDHRRREVRSLAARSSIHVGLFVPFVQALRDSQQRPNWPMHIEALRSAMALGPEAADGVWQALLAQRGSDAAADLYEMLCGYDTDQIGRTPEQIRNGAIARLIDWLENDSLDYRVLAVHNLRQITGKELVRNPAGSMTERAQGIRRWRSRLERDPSDLVPLER